MKTLFALALLAGLGSAGTSQAASLRCRDTELVSDGATKPEVLLKCGEPSFKDSRTETVYDRFTHQTIYRTIEEWTYNFGSNRFMQTIIFVDGRLTEVRAGDFGR